MHRSARAFCFRGFPVAIALLLGSAAAAQEPPRPAQPDEIIVTGERVRERQVRDFVRALSPVQMGSQIARFEEAVCPSAWGLIPAQNDAIAARLREVVAAAGVPVARPGCLPNLMVIAVDEKEPFILGLAKREPVSFGEMTTAEIRRLATSGGPTAAWQQVVQKSDFETASKITAGGRPGFAAAALVIEKRALLGLTLIQLADYAAMRLLAKTDPSRLPSEGAPTILRVIDAPADSEVPVTITQWDLAFLRGLYASAANLHSMGQRSTIARRIRQELEAAQAEAN